MIKLENTVVYGWEAAIRGMRNPMNSWDKSDTKIVHIPELPRLDYAGNVADMVPAHYEVRREMHDEASLGVGPNDLELMKKLVKAGTDHSKFMRMLTVTVDITAPLYWWKEFDTYKVGTVRNSCSTMHKIHAKEFELADFSCEHLTSHSTALLRDIISELNVCRDNYLKAKDSDGMKPKDWWWQLIQLLPSSYNQRATIQMNYAMLRNCYHSRRNHKLDEWHRFCDWVEQLAYSELITDKED